MIYQHNPTHKLSIQVKIVVMWLELKEISLEKFLPMRNYTIYSTLLCRWPKRVQLFWVIGKMAPVSEKLSTSCNIMFRILHHLDMQSHHIWSQIRFPAKKNNSYLDGQRNIITHWSKLPHNGLRCVSSHIFPFFWWPIDYNLMMAWYHGTRLLLAESYGKKM